MTRDSRFKVASKEDKAHKGPKAKEIKVIMHICKTMGLSNGLMVGSSSKEQREATASEGRKIKIKKGVRRYRHDGSEM